MAFDAALPVCDTPDMTDRDPADPSEDPKDAAILRAAFQAFARYGLRRTSMADIAEGAGMSRPALYLHYAGKEDIFSALVRQHLGRSEREVIRVLAAQGSPAETLLAVFHAIDGEAAEALLNSPHADEILSQDTPLIQPEVRQFHASFAGHLARWIAEGVAAGRMSLSGLGATPDEVAATVMAAHGAIKGASRDFASYRRAEAQLAAIFGKALAA